VGRHQAPAGPCATAYCETVKNNTVSVPDDVYRAARVHAAHEGRSVSSLVAEFLGSLSRSDGGFQRLAAEQDRLFARITGFDGGDRLPREELHDRVIR
jgi:hypothetical protein